MAFGEQCGAKPVFTVAAYEDIALQHLCVFKVQIKIGTPALGK
jgi:hypothetical protein